MIFHKNNLIFGAIKAIFVVCFAIVYKILGFFCMQGVFLLAILGLILLLTGVFANNPILLIVYYVVFGITAVISISLLIRKLFRLGNRK